MSDTVRANKSLESGLQRGLLAATQFEPPRSFRITNSAFESISRVLRSRLSNQRSAVRLRNVPRCRPPPANAQPLLLRLRLLRVDPNFSITALVSVSQERNGAPTGLGKLASRDRSRLRDGVFVTLVQKLVRSATSSSYLILSSAHYTRSHPHHDLQPLISSLLVKLRSSRPPTRL